MVGFTTVGNLFGLLLRKALGRFPLAQFTAEANTADLATLASLIQDGKVRTHLERTYSYREIPEAIRYIEAMRTRGKVAYPLPHMPDRGQATAFGLNRV